ncbi:50S ribosomal protein L25 [Patescibacteria group bacterium]
MDTLTLEVNSRESGSARAVRSQGSIPCNFYGIGKDNMNLSVDYQTFRRVFEKAGGNTVIELSIDGKDKTNVLVHDVDQDPVSDEFTHIDFKFVDLDKEVTTDVPLIAVGESKAVREMQGTLMQNKDALTIKCIARILPQTIEFDISVLEDFQSSIHVGDLKLPEGVEAIDDEKLTIATVVAAQAEEEPEEVEGIEGEEGVEGEEGEAAEGAKEGEAPKEGEKKEEGKEGEQGEKKASSKEKK